MLVKNMIMFPWNRSGVAVCIYGNNGTGKGMFLKSLADRVYGKNSPCFVQCCDVGFVYGPYTMAGIDKTLMLFFDEADLTNAKHMGAFKSTTTDHKTGVNEKYEKQKQAELFFQVFFATNSEEPFLVERNDRRAFIIKSQNVTPHLHQFVTAMEAEDWLILDIWLGFIMKPETYPKVVDGWHAQSVRPKTFSYHECKMKFMDPVSQWWKWCLIRGYHCRKPLAIDVPKVTTAKGKVVEDPSDAALEPSDIPTDALAPDILQQVIATPAETPKYKDWLKSVNQQDLYETFVSERDANRSLKFQKFTGKIFMLIGMNYITASEEAFEKAGILEIPDLESCLVQFCRYHDIDPCFVSPTFKDVREKLTADKPSEEVTGLNIWAHMDKSLEREEEAVVITKVIPATAPPPPPPSKGKEVEDEEEIIDQGDLFSQNDNNSQEEEYQRATKRKRQ